MALIKRRLLKLVSTRKISFCDIILCTDLKIITEKLRQVLTCLKSNNFWRKMFKTTILITTICTFCVSALPLNFTRAIPSLDTEYISCDMCKTYATSIALSCGQAGGLYGAPWTQSNAESWCTFYTLSINSGTRSGYGGLCQSQPFWPTLTGATGTSQLTQYQCSNIATDNFQQLRALVSSGTSTAAACVSISSCRSVWYLSDFIMFIQEVCSNYKYSTYNFDQIWTFYSF